MRWERNFILSLLVASLNTLISNGDPISPGLADPAIQPKFVKDIPNMLDPNYIYDTSSNSIEVSVSRGVALTGLVDTNGEALYTPIWGYGTPETGYSWPGRTFQVKSNKTLAVQWHNRIPIEDGYLLTGKGAYQGISVVDTSFHWCYSLHGYEEYTIDEHGTPIVPHLHGGHTDFEYDGNPEFFFSPEYAIKGPQWHSKVYQYDNTQKAAAMWYHDHALGITRLNVYAGMAGFYFLRDEYDTGKPGNPLNLPAYPYEIPLMVQDRMFKENGELFYPAFYGDPYYADFIEGEGATVGDDDPSAMAEFFGDIMTVNGKIWGKINVEPRKYRIRLLNGCDSRFLVVEFHSVYLDEIDFYNSTAIPYYVIGGDQGLASYAVETTRTVLEPAARQDIILDFSSYAGQRILMKNLGGDEPFGGDIPGPISFEYTDRIMAFDVVYYKDDSVADDFDPSVIAFPFKLAEEASLVRKVALFEGHDQFGRLQPLLGTVEPAVDMDGNAITWPDTAPYREANLKGQMLGTMPWHAPTTENPALDSVEEWEIWNLSADAHPIHFHLVQLEVIRREMIVFDSNANDYGEIEAGLDASINGTNVAQSRSALRPAGDGTYTISVGLVQHDGSMGQGYRAYNPQKGEEVDMSTMPEYLTNYPRDVVVALPGQVTTVKMLFDKPGRYNWHCHILAHEDHEMMRIFHVGPMPDDQKPHTDMDSDKSEPTASPIEIVVSASLRAVSNIFLITSSLVLLVWT